MLKEKTTSQADVLLNKTHIQAFADALSGQLIRPGDADYDEHRAVVERDDRPLSGPDCPLRQHR